MKKTFLALLSFFAITITAQAQKKSGAIQYQTQIDPVAAAEASGFPISEGMKARLPKSIQANYELLYNATGASYMPVIETEDSNGEGRGRMGMGRMMMRFGGFGGGNKEYYYSFTTKKSVEVFDLMDTTYVMNSELKVVANALNNDNQNSNSNFVQYSSEAPKVEIIKTDEVKDILNLKCQKTIVKISRKAKILDMDKNIVEEISLWQTNDLGFNFSPDPSLWTEGVVLAIDKKGGSIEAKSIEYRGVSNRDVTAPKKAIAITPEQYKAKMEAMSKRFRDMRGQQGQGGRVTRISIQ